MRIRAKQKHVASDRARRENVPRHILFYYVNYSVTKLPEHLKSGGIPPFFRVRP